MLLPSILAAVLGAPLGPPAMVPPRIEVATYAEAHWLRSDRGPIYSFLSDLRAPILPTCLAAAANDEEGRPITWVVLRTLVRRPSQNGWRHVVVVTDGEDVEQYGRAEYVATCYVVQPGSGYSDLGVTWLERLEALHVFEVFCGAGE